MSESSGLSGLIIGVANKRSIAWAIAKSMAEAGARLAVTYQGERLEENVRDLTAELSDALVLPLDVTSDEQLAAVAARCDEAFGGLDFVVHGAAFAPREELSRPFVETSREGFRLALDISAYSLISVTRVTKPLLEKRGGGSILTLTHLGQRSCLPQLQRDGRREGRARVDGAVSRRRSSGPQNIRVNAISAGPIRTLAASGIGGFSTMLQAHRDRAPLRRNTETSEVGDAARFLLTAAGRGVTGEVLMVDGGYSVMGL